jgi:predicted nucleotidyltransferase
MGKVLESRRSETGERFEQLKEQLLVAEKLVGQKACVYVTGSFGRGEASKHSDLDLFIVGRSESDRGGCEKERSELSNLEEIRVKADLIEAVQKLAVPEFSGDGEYLIQYTDRQLIKTMGTRHDDAINTFTARLLLLLESKPLLGANVHAKVIADVVAAYWKDYSEHKNQFMPAFLANDILRLWRTFCVNYEAGTSTEPEEKRAKRKLKNYKLKHSRLLTCYSALLYLLGIFVSQKTVHCEDAIQMARLTPTARLEWLLERAELSAAHKTIRKLLAHYEKFLDATGHPEADLVAVFLDPEKSRSRLRSANTLGDLTFEAIELIGQRCAFHRVLVV